MLKIKESVCKNKIGASNVLININQHISFYDLR